MIQRSIIVIPSYAIEDLPTDIGHELASDFLNCWTVLWDPRLLVSFKTLPEWKRTDSSSLDLESALVLVPMLCHDKVDQPQRERFQVSNCLTIDSEAISNPSSTKVSAPLGKTNLTDRRSLAMAILERLRAEGYELSDHLPCLLDDFYALGYAVLQIQIMAKKLRYSWNLDWIAFSEQVLLAAQESLNGNEAETNRWLQVCFDTVSQERDRYCSQQIHLLDVVLLAESTLGETLDNQFSKPHTLNVLANNTILRSMRDKNPVAWEALKERFRSGTMSLLGGTNRPLAGNYMFYEDLFREFEAGRVSCEELGLPPVTVFAQFEPGVGFLIPDLLTEFGFQGALINDWAGGAVPSKDNAKIRWQSRTEAPAVDTILGHVVDASSAESFLHFASNLTKQLDYHHVPTKVLAHWPSQYAESMSDLLRVIARSPALGTFVTASKYFQSTNQPYSTDAFKNYQFKIVTPDAGLERVALANQLARYTKLSSQLQRIRSVSHLWSQVGNHSKEEQSKTAQKLENLWKDVIGCLSSSGDSSNIEAQLIEAKSELLQSIAKIMKLEIGPQKSPNGILVVNPTSHAQRVNLQDVPATLEAKSSSRVQACSVHQGVSQAVVDVPPFGFVKVLARDFVTKRDSAQRLVEVNFFKQLLGTNRLIADKNWTMVNEYMELQIDPKKGHLRSLFIPGLRGSRMSGMASMVRRSAAETRKWEESDFLPLENVQLKLLESTTTRGCIEATGTSTLPDGTRVPLTVRYTLWKGARSLIVSILGVEHNECQYVWRTAWHNQSASVNIWQQGAKGKLMAPLQSTLDLIEIDDIEHKIYLATKGQPLHFKLEGHYLVTPLPGVENSFDLAIGVDWPKPWETAQDFCDDPWIIPVHLSESGSDEGAWLAQSNQPNIELRWDSPLDVIVLGQGEKKIQPDAVLWVHETQGKRSQGKLSFFKNVENAWRVDALCKECTPLGIENGMVMVTVRPCEQSRIAIQWSS